MTRAVFRYGLPAVFLLFGVAACTWSGMRSDEAIASRVYVSGVLEYGSAQHIAQTAAPFMGVPFFDVDISGMAKQLESLPWLAGVSVERHWPDGVVIRVKEHKPIAHWGGHRILAADFSVIRPRDKVTLPTLPHLSGPQGTGKRVYTRFVAMNQALAQAGDYRMEQLTLNTRGAWSATLAHGLQLRFGRENLSTRLQRFINYALPQIPQTLAKAGYVDLRYSDGFAVGGKRSASAREKGNEQKA